ncbi:MAG: T9SS type A sorting domain-containing protein [Bacteroidetes bacterium]|nr:T9SS type A sorting domain-containing protein [Bacteroidota bacterium]
MGIEDPLDEILKIHPNPVSRSLYISNISGKEIQSTIIFNSIGEKQVVEFKNQTVSGNLELDVSGLPSGIYFIEIISEDRTEE